MPDCKSWNEKKAKNYKKVKLLLAPCLDISVINYYDENIKIMLILLDANPRRIP